MPYIATSDITDGLLAPHASAAYIARVSAYVEDLASEMEVDAADIIADPLNYRVRQLAIYACCRMICEDKSGMNVQAMSQGGLSAMDDPYLLKLKHYQTQESKTRLRINREMFIGEADERKEFGVEIQIDRG